MKMTISKVLGLKKDLLDLYELSKSSVASECFSEDYVEGLNNIRKAVGEIDQQLELIEVDIDLEKMYLSKFEFKLGDS